LRGLQARRFVADSSYDEDVHGRQLVFGLDKFFRAIKNEVYRVLRA
tara:strand:- start:83 stop:220 length:138 start_codon:yes stop_codon:yes gene_type:complete